MANKNQITYTDLVKPTTSITEAIKALESLDKVYDKQLAKVKKSATEVATSVKGLSGATGEQREQLKKNAAQVDKLSKANAKLKESQSNNGVELKKLQLIQQEQNALTKLEIKLNKAKEGSYNKLSAQYSLNTAKLDKMSKAERLGTEAGRKFEQKTKDIREEMNRMKKATGNATLQVGQYEKAQSKVGKTIVNVRNGFKSMGKTIIASGGAFLGAQGIITLFKKFGSAVVQNSQLISDSLDVIKARFNATFDAIGSAIARGDFSTLADDIKKASDAAEKYTKTQDELADTQRSIKIETSQVENEVYKLREIYTITGNDQVKRLEAVQKANKLLINLQERRRETAEGAISAEIDLIKERFTLTKDESSLITSFISDYGKGAGEYQKFLDSNNESLKQRVELNKIISSGTVATPGFQGQVNTSYSAEALAARRELAKLEATELLQYDKLLKVTDSINDAQRDRIGNAFIELNNQERQTQRLINETTRQESSILNSAKNITETTKTESGKREDNDLEAIRTEFENRKKANAALLKLVQSQFDERFGEQFKQQKAEEGQLTGALLKRNEIAMAAYDDLEKDSGERDIYSLLGLNLNSEQKSAIASSVGAVVSAISQIMDAQVEAAANVVSAQNERVSSAESALDREMNLREQGYASDVAGAKRDLLLQKKSQDDALKQQAKAQKAKARIDTLTQASSLVTAAASIWAAFAEFPPAAIAAIGVMFGSFAFAKVKTAQITKQEYGEGDYSVMEGGSHASGNDIFLGHRNGVDEHMEGGEGRAIINKRNTRKYKNILPAVIKSLNNGTFEQSYSKSFDGNGLSISVMNKGANLKGLESGVDAIKKQGERRYFTDGSGNIIENYKNLKRTFHVN